ncbi:NB-ARC domain-containing protein [aff. Roholtiella sp. LEGE 12411]|uniref:NB-ARC domain-containing protein n=1 Tax=aff. Roholtiella sp. LEGE 12411 TaxID=1828822 RepID=UPI001881F0A6|nr:NB-ARC domain-containing protein [aff. Roholtiella sp. LEGE 12411]MBE9037019.1 NACHT domain-containing protein [aff. Roholtiella sp. LEGE 12411]
MDFSAVQKLNSSAISFTVPNEQKLQRQRYSSIKVTFEEALAVVSDLVFAKRGRHLTDLEILVMRGTWNNREFIEIAENSSYSVNYLQRGVASRLWDILSKTIGHGERVSKKNLRYFLEKATEEYYAISASNDEQKLCTNNLIQVMGGQPPDTSNFYGRTKELSFLKELIIKQKCIALVGVAGIGKSALAAKLLTEVSIKFQPRFDHLIWKSVSHAPSVQDLVTDLIELIRPLQSELSLPKYSQTTITEFIKQLQSYRCLVVLDASEALFQKNNLEQRLEYGLLFRRLVEEQHQSCLLLTSRVLPDEINNLTAFERPIQSVRVEGLDLDAAMQLLSAQGLNDLEEGSKLINTYRGNPLELKAVMNRISYFFASPENFFDNPTTLVSDQFQEMLNQLFKKEVLNELERQIMIFLAEETSSKSICVSFANLLTGINNKYKASVSTSELIKALEVLGKYSLIESIKDPVTKELNFNLQPIIKKYITTDPQGLLRASNSSSNLAIAS